MKNIQVVKVKPLQKACLFYVATMHGWRPVLDTVPFKVNDLTLSITGEGIHNVSDGIGIIKFNSSYGMMKV